jgi:hypothetical protein
LLDCPPKQLHHVIHASFVEDVVSVAGDGLERDAELGSYGTAGVAFAD